MLSVGVRARVLRATYRTTSGPCRSRVPWGTDATVRRAVVSTIGSCACFCLSLLVGKALAQALWPERLEAFAEEARARLFPAPRPACASEVAALRVAEPRWCALKSLRLRARNSAAKHPGLYVHADAHACIFTSPASAACSRAHSRGAHADPQAPGGPAELHHIPARDAAAAKHVHQRMLADRQRPAAALCARCARAGF